MGHFDELSDLDFEEFVADLMRAELDLPFRAGTRGRDAGIDVAAESRGAKHVIQCKHYRDSTYGQLRAAAEQEARKLREREAQFASYRFVTSRRLNHRQRDELAGILGKWLDSPEDVLGAGDLTRLLRAHPEVEARYVKLWLSGAGQLLRLLNAGAYERSRVLVEDTWASLSRYVQTEGFHRAREILHRERVCVIAGPPGVGKTTLARLLLIDAVERGFQPYEIRSGGLSEAWQLLSIDEPQIYLYDDFLGSTALNVSRQEDDQLLRFMRRVIRDPKCLFVLTTREYVLRQAQRVSEALGRGSDEEQKFLLTIDSYNRRERAHIFYNHVYFSGKIDATARKSLLEDHGYMRVIDHPGYSPRLIEWITGLPAHRLTPEEKSNYADFCVAVLDKPSALWSHAYEQGLGAAERALLLALLGLPRQAAYRDAEEAFFGACEARGVDPLGKSFQHALAVLDDSFLASDGTFGTVYLSYINPSLIDYLHSYLLSSRPDAQKTVEGARFFEQAAWLWEALSGENDAPPETLVPSFSSAFRRTFEVPAADGGLFNQRETRQPLDTSEDRIQALMTFCEASSQLAESTREWLLPATADWLSRLGEEGPITSTSLQLFRHLVAAELVALQPHADRLKGRILAMDPELSRWDLLGGLSRIGKSVVSKEDWIAEGAAFAMFAEETLSDISGSPADFPDPDEFQDVAAYYDIALSESLLQKVRDTIDAAYAERGEWKLDYDPGEYEGKDPPPQGESDVDIEAMFDRLADS